MTRRIAVLGTCMVVAVGAYSLRASPSQKEPRRAKVAEAYLRKAATKVVRPTYPPDAQRRGLGGVAVASHVIGTDGRPEVVTVVESPSPDIAESMRTSLLEWRFTPVQLADSGEPMKGIGTITYYFRLSDRKAEVLTPDEALARMRPLPAAAQAQSSIAELTEPEVQRKLAKGAVLLDIRDRHADSQERSNGRHHIPMGELENRGPIELRGKAVVIDCTTLSLQWCRAAANTLMRTGLNDISILAPTTR